MPVLELNDQNLEQTITGNDFVVLDFWAPWCGPCRGFAPVFEAAAEKYPNIVFAKINTEVEQGIAAHFQIRSIPTLMIFREKIGIYSQPGALGAAQFDDLIAKAGQVDMDKVREEIASEEGGAQA
jgi:thioredoxin 1